MLTFAVSLHDLMPVPLFLLLPFPAQLLVVTFLCVCMYLDMCVFIWRPRSSSVTIDFFFIFFF